MSRSEVMASVGHKDTGPEMTLRRALWATGLRYRLHLRLPGRPDLAFPRARVVVFVDGCFWHGCPEHYRSPRSSREFWASKLARNVERDLCNDRILQEQGWLTIHVWEHDVRDAADLALRIRDIVKAREASSRIASKAINSSLVRAPKKIAGAWWQCSCGSLDVQVEACSGPGCLASSARVRPEFATIRCRECEGGQTVPVR